MKICAFSDLHESYNFLKKFPLAIDKLQPDLLLVGGDFIHSHTNSTDYLTDFLDAIESSNVKFFAVPGNSDSRAVAKILNWKGVSLENKTIEYQGEIFSGFSPDPTKSLEEGFHIDNAIVISHIPIKEPSQRLAGAPKIWITGHLHRYWLSKKFDTLFIHLPSAESLKVIMIDSDKVSSKLIDLTSL